MAKAKPDDQELQNLRAMNSNLMAENSKLKTVIMDLTDELSKALISAQRSEDEAETRKAQLEDPNTSTAQASWDMRRIFKLILEERVRQDAKWGEQNHPDGTGPIYKEMADAARDACEKAFKEGRGSWKHIFTEEVMEAMAESDVEKLEYELIQSLAVGVGWLQAVWRRTGKYKNNNQLEFSFNGRKETTG